MILPVANILLVFVPPPLMGRRLSTVLLGEKMSWQGRRECARRMKDCPLAVCHSSGSHLPLPIKERLSGSVLLRGRCLAGRESARAQNMICPQRWGFSTFPTYPSPFHKYLCQKLSSTTTETSTSPFKGGKLSRPCPPERGSVSVSRQRDKTVY